MGGDCFFFAGGGTGGHIYPAIAVAEKLIKLAPSAKIHFLCSGRQIDKRILSGTGFEFTPLPAEGLSIKPAALLKFIRTFFASAKIAEQKFSQCLNPAIIGVGGFAAAPVCWAAHKRNYHVFLINVDIIPGKANKLISRWAEKIFIQFEDTKEYLKKYGDKIAIAGCPLRSSFENPNPKKAVEALLLDKSKKILLITGASTGSQNINKTVCSLTNFFDNFADKWQIVHLAGVKNYEEVKTGYLNARFSYKVVDYYDDMADLLSAASLVIGRSGAVSVAEYAAAGVPSICMPYPFHKDRHQYKNAAKLVEAGAAVIVDDVPDERDRREWLAEELADLMKNEEKLLEMKQNCKTIAKTNAAENIAKIILNT